jgi:hypothetical protein
VRKLQAVGVVLTLAAVSSAQPTIRPRGRYLQMAARELRPSAVAEGYGVCKSGCTNVSLVTTLTH